MEGQDDDAHHLLDEDSYSTGYPANGYNPLHSPPEPKCKFWKNLMCLSIAFLFIFTPYLAIQNLSSTLYPTAGLGVVALACVYTGVFVCCIIAPFGVQTFGCKQMIVAGFMAQTMFTMANAYPTFYTLIPASALIGIMSSFLWTAQGTYITALGIDYSDLVHETANSVLSKFNGIFYFFFQSAQVFGNILTSFILQQHKHIHATPEFRDLTMPYGESSQKCGIHYCSSGAKGHNSSILETIFGQPDYSDTSSSSPPKKLIYIMIGCFVALDVTAILMTCVFMDKRSPVPVQHEARRTIKEMVLATLKIHTDKVMALLVVFFIWNGMEQAYFFGGYTQAFPGCVLGVSHIGYVMVSFGIANALSSVTVGRLEKVTGRVFLFTLAAILNLAVLVFLVFLWGDPGGEGGKYTFVLYLIPVFWGIADSIWQATTCTFVGMVFHGNQEAAFATFRMWQAFGFVIVFSYSHFLCMDIKTYISIAWCMVAFCLYAVAECLVRRRSDMETSVQ